MTPTGSSTTALAHILDVTGLRHRVLAQNIANVNTPGYRRLEVQFDRDLLRAMGGDCPMPLAKPKVVETDAPARVDGNTVDIDTEMNDLMKNGLLYQAAAQLMATRIAALRSAIVGR